MAWSPNNVKLAAAVSDRTISLYDEQEVRQERFSVQNEKDVRLDMVEGGAKGSKGRSERVGAGEVAEDDLPDARLTHASSVAADRFMWARGSGVFSVVFHVFCVVPPIFGHCSYFFFLCRRQLSW